MYLLNVKWGDDSLDRDYFGNRVYLVVQRLFNN